MRKENIGEYKMTRNKDLLQPRIGLGTWKMGSSKSEQAAEVAALQAGIEMGVTVIDTAEMYADGGAEEVTGEAIKGIRDNIFLVTKVLPSNASLTGTITACERSLRRLGTDRIDLYLLHWKGSHPLKETVEAFETLRERGLIKQWGVSNFDPQDIQKLYGLESGRNCAVNQVYYSLGSRGVEYDLLPWQEKQDVATMAYCPLDQGRIVNDGRLQPIADKHNATIAQIALAWLMGQPGVIPIPKSAKVSRVIENVNARDIKLDTADSEQLDRLFPPPTQPIPLIST
ncbi:MAG: diketogulonate reductase-like aldo/keto reductase [Cellvibrionaceae bacterium]